MPDWRQEILRHLAKLNLEPVREQEILEELSQHLNDKYEELLSRGISPEQAERDVMEDLNAGKLIAELRPVVRTSPPEIIHAESTNRLAEMGHNLWQSVRLLRLNPGFALIVILSLALGIGANTAIFQLLNAVRLRVLPVQNPQELASIKIVKSTGGRSGAFVGNSPNLTYALWENIQQQQQAFSDMGAWYSQRVDLSRGGEARYAQVLFVSGNFFQMLGIRPVTGRLILPSDDQKNSPSSVVVISESFWQREFGRNRSVLGSKMTLDGKPFEIIGVSPGSFFGVEVGRDFDVALPLSAEQIIHADQPFLTLPIGWWLGAIGRLKQDWNIDRASAQMATISPEIFKTTLPATYDAVDQKHYLEMVLGAVPAGNGVSYLRTRYEDPLWMLLAISGLVLLIACANLANLMLARSNARQKEMAVRLALGASRGRLIRQMLAESLLLSIIGTMMGLGIAQILSRLLISFLSTQRTQWFLDLQPDWNVMLFTTGLAILTCLLFGLVPAIQATRTPPGEAMKTGTRGTTAVGNRFGLRRALVISQVSLSLLLLVTALLFVGTFRNLITLDAGFQKDRILVAYFDLSPLQSPAERRIADKQQLLSRIRELPGVLNAAIAAIVPLSGSGWNESISIPELSLTRQIANFNQVSTGYFQTSGTPLLAGRDFNRRDTTETPNVAIVTESFAKKFTKGRNPVGITIRVAQEQGKPDRILQVIGFVKDTKYTELREDFTPIVFVVDTQDQRPDQEVQILVRSNQSLPEVVSSVKRATAEMSPAISINFKTFQSMIRDGLVRERMMATLSGFFGFLAALLAMIGLYGVISYMVVQRRNEIGIRIALGANQQKILSMILREAAELLIAGLCVGTFLALISGSVAKALLFGMKPNDPVTMIAAPLGLALIALSASFLPARRAAGLDPTQALREE